MERISEEKEEHVTGRKALETKRILKYNSWWLFSWYNLIFLPYCCCGCPFLTFAIRKKNLIRKLCVCVCMRKISKPIHSLYRYSTHNFNAKGWNGEIYRKICYSKYSNSRAHTHTHTNTLTSQIVIRFKCCTQQSVWFFFATIHENPYRISHGLHEFV